MFKLIGNDNNLIKDNTKNLKKKKKRKKKAVGVMEIRVDIHGRSSR